MLRPAALVKRSLIVVHRWLGAPLSVVFLLWFASGIVMMYRGFPGITAAERLARRLSPGSTWVSHLLQRLVLALVSDDTVLAGVERAARHYRARNDRFAAELTRLGLPTAAGDGLSVWVRVPAPARAVAEQLMRRGWLARPGDEFVLADPEATHRLRLTVHDLSAEECERLLDDLTEAASRG